MANAEIRKANAAAIADIAQHGDSTAKSIAVMMLALNNGPSTTPIEPPRDNALQWAAVLLPSITAVASGYYGYRLGVTQSNNQAYTTQASYGAIVGVSGKAFDTIGQFKPVPFDWAGLGQVVRPNITIGGDGVVAGRDGEINKPVTTNTDNSHDNTNVPPAPSVP
jgi:hypothetical protein